ncbi:MAG: hypothetical protein M3O25_02165, partial [Actinomycetota bacterium]|nr:hypothetical protein [Actinomycetota bacterium]
PQVLAALEEAAPKTTSLLLSLPLSAVSEELPALVPFLSETLGIPEEDVLAAIDENFPGIAQVIPALLNTTAGFDQVPGIGGLTRFNGDPVTSVPDVRDYFSEDVVPVLETQREDFDDLAGIPGGVKLIPPLLLFLGLVVFVFGIVMARRSPEGRASPGAWAFVAAVGVIVCVLVVGVLGLFNRLDSGQEVLDNAAPAFAEDRVAAHPAAIAIVSEIVDTLEPITTENGTVAQEVPELVAFVAQGSGLSEAQVLAALEQNFPHTTDLLLSLPLSDVAAELPGLVTFLSETLGISEEEVLAAIQENFPGLAQVITNLPLVTAGFDELPDVEGFTRFNGDPIVSTPDVRDYFAEDALPITVDQEENFADTADPWPELTVFAPLLLVVGLIVTVFGALMFFAARRRT